jgi:hypothetical protein
MNIPPLYVGANGLRDQSHRSDRTLRAVFRHKPDGNQTGIKTHVGTDCGSFDSKSPTLSVSQQIHFLNGKARGAAQRKKVYFQLLRRVRRLRKRLLRDLESVRRNLEGRTDLIPSRRLMGEEALCLIAEDLAALEQSAKVCERRIMEQEKVPVAEKIISLSDSDASFIVNGGWNTVVSYRPQLGRSGSGFVTGLVLPRGSAADSPHLVAMVKEQITNTGVIPSMASADECYSSQEGLEKDGPVSKRS